MEGRQSLRPFAAGAAEGFPRARGGAPPGPTQKGPGGGGRGGGPGEREVLGGHGPARTPSPPPLAPALGPRPGCLPPPRPGAGLAAGVLLCLLASSFRSQRRHFGAEIRRVRAGGRGVVSVPIADQLVEFPLDPLPRPSATGPPQDRPPKPPDPAHTSGRGRAPGLALGGGGRRRTVGGECGGPAPAAGGAAGARTPGGSPPGRLWATPARAREGGGGGGWLAAPGLEPQVLLLLLGEGDAAGTDRQEVHPTAECTAKSPPAPLLRPPVPSAIPGGTGARALGGQGRRCCLARRCCWEGGSQEVHPTAGCTAQAPSSPPSAPPCAPFGSHPRWPAAGPSAPWDSRAPADGGTAGGRRGEGGRGR